ncbi:MAG: rod shape-determining protein MreC [Parcubacteria group bacterium]|nr:rod shape-determining protein MreC [Parcubacteria group bacterium]
MPRRALWFIGAVIIIAGALWRFDFLAAPLRTGALTAFAPAFRAGADISDGVMRMRARLRSQEELAEENALLREELNRATTEALLAKRRAEENESLKEIFGRSGNRSGALLLAAVLARPNRSPYDTFLIDVGSESGVKVGDRVFVLGDIVIGTIDVVSGSASRVKLFSSPGAVIDVLFGSERISVPARGIGGGNFEARLPRGVDIREGDIVAFPAISTDIAGVVQKVLGDPADSFQTILFKSPVNVYETEWVEVLVGERVHTL